MPSRNLKELSNSMGIKHELVEKYQILYKRKPSSRVFAPLAESYRQMKLFDEALDVCLQGTIEHPEFSGGYVVLAKIYHDLEKWRPSLKALDRAIKIDAENLLAHRLKGELLLKLKQPEKSLEAFKLALLIDPSDQRAQKMVLKLEAIQSSQFLPETFKFLENNYSARNIDGIPGVSNNLDREIAVIDSLISNSSMVEARKAIREALLKYPENESLQKRTLILDDTINSIVENQNITFDQKKIIRKLQNFLYEIETQLA